MLFTAKDASLARGGVTVISDLEVEVEAERVALLGDWTVFFDRLRGEAELVAGRFELMGQDALEAVRQRKVGIASARSRYNGQWTSAGYLEKIALLDGDGRAQAKRRARQALEALGLGKLASRQLGGLTRVEWLAVELAQASLGAPALVAVEAAFDGLGAVDADWLERVLSALGCKLMVSFTDLAASQRHRVLRFDYALVLFRGRVVAQGAPAAALAPGSYLVTVTRQAKRLRDELAAVGCAVQADPRLDDTTTTQLLVSGEVDDLSDRIVGLAVEHEVPIIELLPVGIPTQSSADGT